MYSEKTMKYFKNPKNMGSIKNPDGIGKVGNVVCGDVMHLYIKVYEKAGKEIISEIKFETFGCVAAIATSSMVTELAKGKPIEDALKITKLTIADELGGLPPVKLHCSVLAVDALNEAIFDYYTKQKRTIPESLQKEHDRIQREYNAVCQKHG